VEYRCSIFICFLVLSPDGLKSHTYRAVQSCASGGSHQSALAGTYGGYQARTGLVKTLNTRDLYVALLEDVVTIVGSFFLVSRL
jgi:uncharacterized membrane protein